MRFLGTKVLETERLLLRPFHAEDAAAMYRNWASDDDVTRYLTWPTHESEDASRGLLEYWSACYCDPKEHQWVIALKDTDEPIGSISVVSVSEEAESAEIGYCIGQKWWRQGYTSEAAARVIRFLFREEDAKRVCAKHDPRNPNSGRVMRKCGMQFEGTLRQAARNNMGICDVNVYSILASEYFKDL